ncbi:MAG: hypothetical protein QOI88_338 [Gammaproteobacteria bacterium]|nr:hypothetical protein [Gammaproteobacteria bacterium]
MLHTRPKSRLGSVFTQCSKCETVFRLSAEALRAAGGQVRCGRCGEVFNALARLAEEATAFPTGESSLELETRADAILQSVESVESVESVPPVAAPAAREGDEIAHLKVLDTEDEGSDFEASLEFTLPPGELDRIFVERAPTALQLLAASVKPSPAQGPPAGLASPAQDAAAQIVAAPTQSVPTARVSGLEVSEDIRQEMLASYQRAELPEINPPRRRQLPFSVWASAAVVLALLLVFQVVHTNEEWLSVHAPLVNGGKPAAALSAYQLRQWGVTGDPGANGTLRVRASIMNAAAQLQPYPLLRVTLADRFGTRVGAREFEPAEYLGKAPARLLAPGERVDATLNILDPGKDAEGFEIDVCVRSAEKKIFCAGDAGAAAAAPQSK